MPETENASNYLHTVLKNAFLSGDFKEYSNIIQNEDKPQVWETWVVGLSLLTVSAVSSPLGMLLIPLLSKSLYERFMTFLVALGIGAMSGSVLFILIPQAFAMTELESFFYVTKSVIIISAIYAFFAVDRFLQIFLEIKRRRSAKRKIHVSTLKSVINESKEKKKRKFKRRKKLGKVDENSNTVDIEKEKDDLRQEFEVQMITNNLVRTLSKRRRVVLVKGDTIDEIKYKSSTGSYIDLGTLKNRDSDTEEGSTTSTSTVSMENPKICINMEPETVSFPKDPEMDLSVQVVEKQMISKPEVSNVAYMIIFGTSANNFVDGMSTGAAFSDSLTRGISIGLAVISQQFPQELGTLAILVNSGLGLRRTLLLNLIPMLLTYLGFAVGVVLDNINEGYDEYIYSISSGMYLYIFLGTLIPEIRDSVTEILKTDLPEAFLTTLLQFSGIAFGTGFMFFMSLYGGEEG
ncbi:hypothetical protein FO519_003316 [Halicephalobus sp. NKZ332]|nr:hypothetical protein FO519_003316 [Halicephalobus sp. NKZ332]